MKAASHITSAPASTGWTLSASLARLREIMEVEKAFADEELSLKDLAGDLGISPHQLSQILNERIRKNFSTFVNEYRIDEAKKLLVEEPDLHTLRRNRRGI